MKKSPTTQSFAIADQWRPNHHSLECGEREDLCIATQADLTDPLWAPLLTNLLGVEPQSSVTIDLSGTKVFY
ncbi:MAG: hypothetical protein ACI9JZ_001611 [Lentimonas sp.]|jgi:hypothetical protein